MKICKQVVAWILVVAMMCSDIQYVKATSYSKDTQEAKGTTETVETVEIVETQESEETDSVEETEESANYENAASEASSVESVEESSSEEASIAEETTEGDPEDTDIAKGEMNGVTWVIDKDGKLTVEGSATGDFYYSSCWGGYSNQIKSAIVSVSGVKTMEGWFGSCRNIKKIQFENCDTSEVKNMNSLFIGCEQLTEIDWGTFDTSNVEDMGGMFYGCIKLKKLDLSHFNTEKVTRMNTMFCLCRALESVNLSSFDTSNVTIMNMMFENCIALKELDLSSFNTKNVTDMSSMFAYANSLKKVNLSSFDTSNVENMRSMFLSCTLLEELDLSSFDTKKVTDMGLMFDSCKALKSIKFSSKFTTNKVSSFDSMFMQCESIKSLDLSSFDTSNAENIYAMFEYCRKLEEIKGAINTQNLTTMDNVFCECNSLKALDTSKFDLSNIITMHSTFANCNSLKKIDLSNQKANKLVQMDRAFENCFNLEEVKLNGFAATSIYDMNYTFSRCESLKEIDLSGIKSTVLRDVSCLFAGCESLEKVNLKGFVTDSIVNMGAMFSGCSSLTQIDLSGFHTSNVTSMGGMFNDCKSLKFVNVSRFDTQNVTDMSGMFAGCEALTYLNVHNFKTDNVLYMDAMFGDCKNLTNLDITSLNTENVCTMQYMFYGCEKLKLINVSAFKTSNVYDMTGMFQNCKALKQIDVSNFDTSNLQYVDYMFDGCSSLTELNLEDWNFESVTNSYEFLNVVNMFPVSLVRIKVPTNVKVDIPFSGTMKLIDAYANEYTALPKFWEESMWLAKNVTSFPSGYLLEARAKLNPQMAYIELVDAQTEQLITKATVTICGKTYKYAKQFPVSIENKDQWEPITIVSDGYIPIEDKMIHLKKGQVIRCGLYKTKELQIFNVAGIGARNCDLLRDKVDVGYLALPSGDKSLKTHTMNITVYAVGEIEKYELLCDNKVIQENKTGIFPITIIDKAGGEEFLSIVSPSLKRGGKYSVRITDKYGKTDIKNLSIKVGDYKWSKQAANPNAFALGNDIIFTVPESVPLIGNQQMQISAFSQLVPVVFDVNAETGDVKICINDSPDFDLDCWEFSKNAVSIADKGLAIKGNQGFTHGVKVGCINGSAKIFGYGEGNLKDVANGVVQINLTVGIELSASAGYTQYWVIGVVPVELSVKGTVNGSCAGVFAVRFENGKMQQFLKPVDGIFGTSVELTVGAGVGVAVVGKIEASLTGGLHLESKLANIEERVWLQAQGKVSAEALGGVYEHTFWESDKYKLTVYHMQNGRDMLSYNAITSFNAASDGNVAEETGRQYLAYADGFTGVVSSIVNDGDELETHPSKSLVKAAVLPVAGAKIVAVNDKLYMFWLDDVITRSSLNRSAIFYATSQDGVQWTEPKQLIEEDATLDTDFNICTQNGEIYIVWQNASKEFVAETEPEEIAQSLGIQAASMNATTGKITLFENSMDSLGYFEFSDICADGTAVYTAYVQNDLKSGSIFGNHNDTLYFEEYKEGKKVNSKKATLPENYQIAKLDVLNMNGEIVAICDADTDGNFNTNSDREVIAVKYADGSVVKITDNETFDCFPVATENGKLYWNTQEGIKFIEKLNGDVNLATSYINADNCFAYNVITKAGKDYILYEDGYSAMDGLAIYESEQQADGSFGAPVEMIKVAGGIKSELYGVAFSDNLVVAGVEGDFLTDGTLLKDLYVYKIGDKPQINVDYVEYDAEKAIAGEELPLQITVSNQGNVVMQQLNVAVDGNIVQTIENANLEIGETKEFTVNGYWVDPDTYVAEEHELSVEAVNGALCASAANTFTVGLTDLAVEVEAFVLNDHDYLDIYVKNKSAFAAGGTILVHVVTPDGKVIFEEEVPTITSDEIYLCTVSLAEFENDYVHYYVEVVADNEDRNIANNDVLMYMGYGKDVVEESAPEPTPITAIFIESTVEQLRVGEKKILKVTENVADTNLNFNVLWSSSNSRIVAVDSFGNIKGMLPGTAEVTATYGDLSATCTVVVSGNQETTFTVMFDTKQTERIAPITGIAEGQPISLPTPQSVPGYRFVGWFTETEGGTEVTDVTAINQSMTLHARWEAGNEGLWIEKIPSVTYNGKAHKPNVKVYHGDDLLTLGKDYTVSYKNNVNAGQAIVTVKGKGNYSGSDTAEFTIAPVSLKSVNVPKDLYMAYTGKVLTPKFTLSYLGKSLKLNKDYLISSEQMVEKKDYVLKVSGNGNYKDTVEMTVHVTEGKLADKFAVSKIAKQNYAGEKEIIPSFTVKYGKELLTADKDYTVAYFDNTSVGRASIVITGQGEYVGTKTIYFDIIGTPISKAKLTGIETQFYTGAAIKQDKLLVSMEGKELVLDQDYTVTYEKNEQVGTATMLITGMGAYSGSIKKTFKITPFVVLKEDAKLSVNTETVPYAKGGAKAVVNIVYDGKVLTEGKDYAVTSRNNNIVTDKDTKVLPCATIQFKGNYSGKIDVYYNIVKQDIAHLQMIVSDKAYAEQNEKKAESWKQKTVKIVDLDGKVLKAGVDYEKTLQYRVEGVETVTNVLPAGSVIYVTAKGIGNYADSELTVAYKIVPSMISTAKITVATQEYDGKAKTPKLKSIVGKNKQELVEHVDYEIVGYSDNVNKGTATLTVQGRGNYGGTKTVKFKITAMLFKWFKGL